MSKKKTSAGGLVYSTNPDFFKEEPEALVPHHPASSTVKVTLDRKQRAGKTVTVISGIDADASTLEQLARTLKTQCGTGGAVKEQEILLQGDYKNRVTELLIRLQYRVRG